MSENERIANELLVELLSIDISFNFSEIEKSEALFCIQNRLEDKDTEISSLRSELKEYKDVADKLDNLQQRQREEIASLLAEVEDWRETQRSVMSETCPTDEKHCTCAPMLKKENASLRAEVKRLAELEQVAYWKDKFHEQAKCVDEMMRDRIQNVYLRKQLEETASEAKSKLEERDMSLASLMVGICNNTGQYAMPNEGEDALQWLTRVSNETKLQRDTLKKQLEEARGLVERVETSLLMVEDLDPRGRALKLIKEWRERGA